MLEHGDPLAPSTTNCRLSTARMFAAGFLSSGETRESLCAKLGVDPAFGNLPAQDPELAVSETTRGTGFSPKSAAIENLGCGGGACSGCSSSLASHGHTAFGHVTLRRGSQLTAQALEQMYSVVEKMGCKQPPTIAGAPPPPRKLSLA